MSGLMAWGSAQRTRGVLIAGAVFLAAGQPAIADDPFGGATIVRVEEDWVLDVGLAEEGNSAPEIVTVFGPHNPAYGVHALFEMNHSTQPDFVRGGMQIQCWYGDWYLGGKRHSNQSELQTVVERIKYTCVTSLNAADDLLRLEIKGGDSVTYGSFGGDGSLKLLVWTTADNLNSYNPETSITHSRVTFGANRVNRFLRSEIRYYTSTGDVITDPADRVVHELVEAEVAPPPVNE